MAKTVFGIPGADANQGKSSGAVAPKGVTGAQTGHAIPQKAGSVAIPGASRGLPSRPPVAQPKGLSASLPPAPPVPGTTTAPPPPIHPPLAADAGATEDESVDVQGRTVFGMPAMQIPAPGEQPEEPGPAEAEPKPAPERESLWPKTERAAVPIHGTSTHPPAPVPEPIDELSASMLEPELSGEEQITTPIPTEEPTGEEALETARLPVMPSVMPPPRASRWVWVMVVAGGLALAIGSGWLVWQMIQGGGGLALPTVETTSPQAQD